MLFWKKEVIVEKTQIESPPIELKEVKVQSNTERLHIPYYFLGIKGDPNYTFYFLDKERSEKIFNDLLRSENFYVYSHTGPGAAEKINTSYDMSFDTFEIQQVKKEINSFCIFSKTIKSISLSNYVFRKNGKTTVKINISKDYFYRKIKEHDLKIEEYGTTSKYFRPTENDKDRRFLKDTNMKFQDLIEISKSIVNDYVILWETE